MVSCGQPEIKQRIYLFALILYLAAVCCQAQDLIPPSYHSIAMEHKIPSAVLYGVAMTESQLMLSSRKVRPWPWTLNVAGVSRRYPTRIAAWKSLKYYLEQGIDLIDVGIMQISWRYHQQKLGTPWEALEPFKNTRAGAKILKAEYKKTGEWPAAIGRYHSPGQKTEQKQRAKKYVRRVLNQIKRIQVSPIQLASGQ